MRFTAGHLAGLLLLLIAIPLLSISCTQDLEGIFYSLEKEVKTPDNSLPNTVNVTGITKVQVSGVNVYYAAAGSVFYRKEGETDWHKISTPMSDGFVTDIEYDGTNIVVGVTTGSNNGVFLISPASNAYDSTNYYASQQIKDLFRAGPNGSERVFASVGQSPTDFLLWNAAGKSFASTNLNSKPPAGQGRWVLGVTWDGTDFWACTATDVYRTALANVDDWSTSSVVTKPNGKENLSDIFAANSTTVYVSSRDGYILRWDSGVLASSDSGDKDLEFTKINIVNGKLIIGTDNAGYRHFDSSFNIDKPEGNYGRIPTLLATTVLSTYVDTTKNTLFLGTLDGLWRGDYSTNVNSPEWGQE